MDKEKKAQKILDKGGVLYLGKKNGNLHFLVKSESRKEPYKVVRETRGGRLRYICECNRAVWSQEPCSHILASTIFTCANGLI